MPFYSTYISSRLCLFRFEQHITKLLPITACALFQPRLQRGQANVQAMEARSAVK
jgi:hypothetical protein